MILVLAKLALVGGTLALLFTAFVFALYLRSILPVSRAYNEALKTDKGLNKMLLKLQYDAIVSTYAGPVGFGAVWTVVLFLLSLLLWIVA